MVIIAALQVVSHFHTYLVQQNEEQMNKILSAYHGYLPFYQNSF